MSDSIKLAIVRANDFNFKSMGNIVSRAKKKKSDFILFPENYPLKISESEFAELVRLSKRQDIGFLVTKRGGNSFFVLA